MQVNVRRASDIQVTTATSGYPCIGISFSLRRDAILSLNPFTKSSCRKILRIARRSRLPALRASRSSPYLRCEHPAECKARSRYSSYHSNIRASELRDVILSFNPFTMSSCKKILRIARRSRFIEQLCKEMAEFCQPRRTKIIAAPCGGT